MLITQWHNSAGCTVDIIMLYVFVTVACIICRVFIESWCTYWFTQCTAVVLCSLLCIALSCLSGTEYNSNHTTQDFRLIGGIVCYVTAVCWLCWSDVCVTSTVVNIRAMTIVWMITATIIRAVLCCCIVSHNCTQSYTLSYEQSLQCVKFRFELFFEFLHA